MGEAKSRKWRDEERERCTHLDKRHEILIMLQLSHPKKTLQMPLDHPTNRVVFREEDAVDGGDGVLEVGGAGGGCGLSYYFHVFPVFDGGVGYGWGLS